MLLLLLLREKHHLTGNFLLKDQWVSTTGVYTYDFSTGEIAADSRLNIKHGKLTMDNRGDYWFFSHRVSYLYHQPIVEKKKIPVDSPKTS